MKASSFRRVFNLWPPFLFSAIRVQSLSNNYSEAKVVLCWFETEVVTASGEVIARVRKQIYVRLKPKAR